MAQYLVRLLCGQLIVIMGKDVFIGGGHMT